MQTLTEARLLELIGQRRPVHARVRGAGLRIRIDHYLPVVACVLHAGTVLPDDYGERLAVNDEQRQALEERGCEHLAELMPISIIQEESRLACDLNQPLSHCLPEQSDAGAIWQRLPTRRMRERAERSYRRFYRILDALIDQLESKGDACLLVDLHSHTLNHQSAGLFHIPTETGVHDGKQSLVDELLKQLARIKLPQLTTSVSSGPDNVESHQLANDIERRHANTRVLSLVISPIFREPKSGAVYPILTDALASALHEALLTTAAHHAHQHSGRPVHIHDLLPDRLPTEVLKIDRALKKLARGLETLLYINPINLGAEQRRFQRSNGGYAPEFRYRPLRIDPFAHREKLYRLPVDTIRDPALRQLYREAIDALAQRIDLLVSIGSERFLYNSLRYYGEPDDIDLANARFLLHAAERHQEQQQKSCSAEQMLKFFSQRANQWGLNCRTELSDRILAAAMVSSGRNALLVRRDARVTESEMQALAHHELGIHMVTTLNARRQPLQIFSLGLPGNTHAQEGLAILSEYLCGHLTLGRLKTLALRVIAVHQMLHHNDFRRTWRTLTEDYGCSSDEAFSISARVHRGGGFTKDHLYLSGFREALRLYQQGDISALLIGKTGFGYLPLLQELLARGLLHPPEHRAPALETPVASHPEIDYLVRSIR
ncbi:flavohemoglobin expression-modulating QEGLA motif protein [Marinobacterium sp. D7]|uniref:flavohemoglobin expression-modulating QEGLA motif protein n=1 Tax=Marinobacterium ramblicola TaxID=2849041 RepID=UPI001C2D0B84|nr:flavohemoglobin expression-modulating QEGLA motif protein [Marinobacterium ramblicola]MBV1789548.1 flavohemoglobin expression-modulating QEGLA motif protein [Marinobacterium ramblicola]